MTLVRRLQTFQIRPTKHSKTSTPFDGEIFIYRDFGKEKAIKSAETWTSLSTSYRRSIFPANRQSILLWWWRKITRIKKVVCKLLFISLVRHFEMNETTLVVLYIRIWWWEITLVWSSPAKRPTGGTRGGNLHRKMTLLMRFFPLRQQGKKIWDSNQICHQQASASIFSPFPVHLLFNSFRVTDVLGHL